MFAMKKDREWATCAVSCYMHAITYGEARARLMITRVIWLLSYDAEVAPMPHHTSSLFLRTPVDRNGQLRLHLNALLNKFLCGRGCYGCRSS